MGDFGIRNFGFGVILNYTISVYSIPSQRFKYPYLLYFWYMSKANGVIEKKDTFLQHVSLKNYKSIKDVEIDFKPGLNNNYDLLLDSESIIEVYFENVKVEIQALRIDQITKGSSDDSYYNLLYNHEIILKIDDEQVKVEGYEDLRTQLFGNNYVFKKSIINHGYHYKESSLFINLPFSFVLVNNGRVSRDLMTIISNDNRTEFNYYFFSSLYVDINYLYSNNKSDISVKDLKDEIISFSRRRFLYINNVIFNYSPIHSIRLNPDFNIIVEGDGEKLTVTNFYLEFAVDQNWFTFNLLSDGTKRLFYILSEILSNTPPTYVKNKDLNIILLEEPELGIHPHQLHQLMQFIQEQSREKQIILTTHSPQVLDVLGPDGLDRIIISHYDTKNKTQLSHLTEKEINKAKKYMKEEAFLSDYWRFSDLEPAS